MRPGLVRLRPVRENRDMRRFMWIPLLALAAGCWEPRYFSPRENRSAVGPDGDLAAAYQVESVGDPPVRAELRVWSHGARAHFTEDDEVVDLHVGFEVENNGAVPLELDVASLACHDLLVDGVLQPPLAAHEVTGGGVAPPGATARIDAVFRPPTTRPSRVDSFAVRFVLRAGDDAVLTQSTPFAPDKGRWRYNGYYGAWGWGWGYYGWGSHPWGCYGPWGIGFRGCW
jgi:hypothetical protein